MLKFLINYVLLRKQFIILKIKMKQKQDLTGEWKHNRIVWKKISSHTYCRYVIWFLCFFFFFFVVKEKFVLDCFIDNCKRRWCSLKRRWLIDWWSKWHRCWSVTRICTRSSNQHTQFSMRLWAPSQPHCLAWISEKRWFTQSLTRWQALVTMMRSNNRKSCVSLSTRQRDSIWTSWICLVSPFSRLSRRCPRSGSGSNNNRNSLPTATAPLLTQLRWRITRSSICSKRSDLSPRWRRLIPCNISTWAMVHASNQSTLMLI